VSSNVSRDTFIPSRGYQELIFSQQRPLLDAELNEQQGIYRRRVELVEKTGIGNGAIGDGFLALTSGAANSLLIYQGTYYNDGRELTLFNNVLITGLTTPLLDRTDLVYIDYYDEEIDGTQDPNIIDPIIGAETAVRKKTTITVKVAEGTAVPLPASGHVHIHIATLNRLGGNPNISTAMIADMRLEASRNFVLEGLRPSHTGGLAYSITAGECFVANVKFTPGGFAGAVPANSTRYIYVDNAGVIQVAANLPTTYHVPIAEITSNTTTITTLTDLRMFSNLATSTPRIDVTLNLDGTVKEGAISLANLNILRPHEQTSPNMTVYVEAGTFIKSDGTGAVTYVGGSSPVFALPVGFSKIDLLTIDDNGNLGIEPGTPAGSPVPPTYPIDKQVLAEVTVNPGDSQILDAAIRDTRFFLNLGGGPGIQIRRHDVSAAANQQVFNLPFNYVPGTNDILVFSSGMIQVKDVDYLESSSSSITFIHGRAVSERVTVVRIAGGAGGGGGGGTAPALYYLYTATGGEATIGIPTGTYSPGTNSLRVYRNGKKITYPAEYTEPSTNSIGLTTPALPGDKYEFIVEAGGGGGGGNEPRSVPIQAFSADPTASPSAGVVSGIPAIDTIDFSSLVTQRIRFTVAAPRDMDTSASYAIALQLWGASGFLNVTAGVFLRVRYAVIVHGDDVIVGGTRDTSTLLVAPFTGGSKAHYIHIPLDANDFTTTSSMIAFEFERDTTNPGDTYNDIFRLLEMRFKYVSA